MIKDIIFELTIQDYYMDMDECSSIKENCSPSLIEFCEDLESDANYLKNHFKNHIKFHSKRIPNFASFEYFAKHKNAILTNFKLNYLDMVSKLAYDSDFIFDLSSLTLKVSITYGEEDNPSINKTIQFSFTYEDLTSVIENTYKSDSYDA